MHHVLIRYLPLEPLLHSSCNRTQVAVHLARVLSQNQADNGLAGDVNILEAAKNVNLLVCQHDSCPTGVFNGELCLSVLPCYSPNCSAEVLALERFHVLDLECLYVQICLC